VHLDDLSIFTELVEPTGIALGKVLARLGGTPQLGTPQEDEPGKLGLQRLNALPLDEARAQFLNCCGATMWAESMLSHMPFSTLAELHATATDLLARIPETGWKEAFSRHPRIGETAGASKWSAQEQRGVDSAAQQTLAELAELNQAYFDKFSYIFIVCASGKSAEEMLTLLKQRLGNDPQRELIVAAAEQSKITHLRLDKLLL
jgi:2-oxo-4-hydroxy-4-carboxy-5-ureidoimidazoline decarboxylase